MLTAKQAAFVREYLIDRNATQAAIRAGYSADTAQQQGSRLLLNVVVKRALEAKERHLQAKAEMTVERVAQMLLDDREMARQLGQPSAAVTAAMGVAKLYGLIVDKTQNENRNIPADELPDAELARIAAGGSDRTDTAKGGKEKPARVH